MKRSPARLDALGLSRRDLGCSLLTLGAAGVVACGGSAPSDPVPTPDGGDPDVGQDTSPSPDAPPGCSGLDRGPVTDFPVGTWRLVGTTKATQIVVGHDTGGLFAFSAICTHQSCVVSAPSSTGDISCPCHGSRFDGNGAVTRGPATKPLPHFAVTVCDGHVYVDQTKTVADTTRTPA